MTGEIISLPDIDVSVFLSRPPRVAANHETLQSAITAQNRTPQEPQDAVAVVEIGLWQDVYGSHAHDSLVERVGMGRAVDQGM
mgnify:FL=1